jgi:Vacuolar sorting protein 9 (VPS9) domain
VFAQLAAACKAADSKLAQRLRDAPPAPPKDCSSTVEALSALRGIAAAATACEKLDCMVRAVEAVCAALDSTSSSSSGVSADALLVTLARHVAACGGGLQWHAELAFCEEFVR